MTDYPAAVYSPRTKENKAGIVYDAAKTEIGFAEDVTKLDDEVVAIQTELGTTPKGSSADIAERIKGLKSLADANADVITIKAGNVGIDTPNPETKLDINSGDVHIDINQYFKMGASNWGIGVESGPTGAQIVTATGLVSISGNLSGRGWVWKNIADTVQMELTGDTGNLIINNGNVGIGITIPDCKLRVAGAISSATLVHSAVGPTDNLNVAGVNTVFINAGSNAVTIGGFIGGVDGQVLNIVIINPANNVTLEHAEGGGNQDILLHKGTDETIDGHFGGWTLICHAGVDWHDASHAKHV